VGFELANVIFASAPVPYYADFFFNLGSGVRFELRTSRIRSMNDNLFFFFLSLFISFFALFFCLSVCLIALITHRTTQQRRTRTNIHARSGIRTHDPSNQAAKTHVLDRTATVTGRPIGLSGNMGNQPKCTFHLCFAFGGLGKVININS
jgi:hypothetical protein